MEHMTPAPLAYVSVDGRDFAFSGDGRVDFTARPGGTAATDECFLIVDIYAADDKTHPGGHAGWWECRLAGPEAVAVTVTRADGRLSACFNGAAPENAWVNPDFDAAGRALTMHLVVRAWRSTSVLFDDALPLYADAAARAADASLPFHSAVPADVPPRWFVWPPAARVLLAFDSLRSAGASDFCGQLASLLAAAGIPHEIYAWRCTPAQRRRVKPAQYLRHEAGRDDIVFFVFSGGNSLFPLIAELPCKKILYHRHLPDYRRIQAFDAELARELSETDAFAELLPAFDGVCCEAEHTRRSLVARAGASGEGAASFPPDLGVFPPSLWAKRWDGVAEEACQVAEPFLLSVGSFRPDRRHEDAMRVFEAVAERDPSVNLVIAGWPSTKGYWDYLRYLREHVHTACSSRIVFLQSCPEGQLLYLYRRALLFLSANAYDGYNGALEDALAFGLPVVARQTRFSQQVLGFSGLQYDAESPLEMVVADILNICADRRSFPAARAIGGPSEACPAHKALDVLYRVALAKPKPSAPANGRRKV